MQHKLLEAKATTTTDLGEFEAIAAAYSVDRVNERILPGAFADTIKAWRESGKQIPLHWNHSGSAEDIIGTVDPASMEETDEGLYVKGRLDLEDSDVAKEAWRSMKANRVGLSFGYMVQADGQAEDGVRELKKLDLFEVTVTPAPANPDTRFIDIKAMKAMSEEDMLAAIKEMRERLDEMERMMQQASTEAEQKQREMEQELLADRYITLRALSRMDGKSEEIEEKTEADEGPEATAEVEDRQTRSPENGQVSRQDPLVSSLRAAVLRTRVR